MDRDVEGGLGENERVACHSSGKHPTQILDKTWRGGA